ncbi:MAG: YbaB/EbfC family nucleoid-associated protein [Tissierellia bacterium]|nr:YbaB/EbfC family nucleoid-associated protein [Tissierellia bacterium]
MRGRSPFGGGQNMNSMMKQMQKMQKQIEDAQKEIEETEVTATAGGGVIEVVANGKKEIISISIDKDVVDPEDVEMLQDMIVAGVNEAIRAAEKLSEEKMSKITGGLNIPGL